ncbi:MAG TPA: OpcA/G6PD domain-containing protein [Vicinamibacterales bacterium]|nr:OpcA/G6PD domain-containing protein [Vicinamibacterales bacterium]
MAAADRLLPAGRDVPFADIEVTLARLVRDGRDRKGAPARALTATVIVIGDLARLAAAAEALERLGESGGVRTILISEGEHTAPTARVTESAIAIAGLAPRFLNNAVAALRLSSLPAVVWWRGGSVDKLHDLAGLADRMILDAEDPVEGWRKAQHLFERTALTDLRWTRLTRWRSAVAHLFDLPPVRAGLGGFRRLTIEAADPHAARLYAGWLRACLKWTPSVAIDIAPAPANGARTPLRYVRLEGTGVAITAAGKTSECLTAAVDGFEESARIVPVGDATLAALIGEELGVRTRDLAFERALASALELEG